MVAVIMHTEEKSVQRVWAEFACSQDNCRCHCDCCQRKDQYVLPAVLADRRIDDHHHRHKYADASEKQIHDRHQYDGQNGLKVFSDYFHKPVRQCKRCANGNGCCHEGVFVAEKEEHCHSRNQAERICCKRAFSHILPSQKLYSSQ